MTILSHPASISPGITVNVSSGRVGIFSHPVLVPTSFVETEDYRTSADGHQTERLRERYSRTSAAGREQFYVAHDNG